MKLKAFENQPNMDVKAFCLCHKSSCAQSGIHGLFPRVSSEINFVDPQFVELRIFHYWHCWNNSCNIITLYFNQIIPVYSW